MIISFYFIFKNDFPKNCLLLQPMNPEEKQGNSCTDLACIQKVHQHEKLVQIILQMEDVTRMPKVQKLA
jgi:hypothetical protein